MNFFIQLKIFLFTILLITGLTAQEFHIMTEEFPPYNHTQKGKLKGISVEIMFEILKRLELPNNIEVLPWTDAYDRVKNQDNQILFSTTRTPSREELFKWVGPLVPNNTVFFAKKGRKFDIKKLDDAKNISKIGVYSDDFGELLLKEKGFDNLEAVRDNIENVSKLVSGDIDLWIINELTGKYMARSMGMSNEIEKVYEVQKDYMYIAFSKSTPEATILKWQKVLDEIKSDGTYAQIFSNWIMFSYSDDLKTQENQTIDLTTNEKQWLKEHPVIRVAPDPDYAPFQYSDSKGISHGLANDYLSLIEEKLNIRFEMMPTQSWGESLDAVKNHQADMVVVAAKTPEREKHMSYTSPYVEFPDVIITRKNSKKIDSIVELYGKKLATVDGFAINHFIKKYYPAIELVFKPDVAAVLRSVSMGEVDATVINVATASSIIEKENIANLRVGGDTGFTYKLSFASRNDWPILTTILEKVLSTISAEDRTKMLRKWISIAYNKNEEKSIIILTSEEEEWLKSHPVITLAPDPKWAPVEYFDDNGKYTGITSEYIVLLEKRLGIKFHVVRFENWSEVLEGVTDGTIDMITAARTPQREKSLLFTEPYLTLPSVIIANNKIQEQITMSDLNGKTIAIVEGYAIIDYIEKSYPDINIRLVKSIKEGLQLVSYGNITAYIGGIATTSYVIEQEIFLNLHVAGDADYVWNVGFASNKSQPLLNRILSKGLATITKEDKQKIVSKWLIKEKSWQPSKELIIALSIAFGLIFIAAIIIWNRLLAKKVVNRTEELNKTLEISEVLREKADHAQQEAERANRAKSEFLASMSHEIRTPMNAIIGMADLISMTTLTKEQKEYVNIFQNAGENLLHIINDILDISKIESGQLILENVPFNLLELIEHVSELMAVRAHKSGLELIKQIGDEVTTQFLGDSIRLQQILINLLGNAIKFTSSGEVILKVEQEQSENDTVTLHFSVLDTGIGVAHEKMELIFDSFSQADSSTTRKFGGTGLGLAISKQLVTKMGGKIWVEANPIGGSIFNFTIKIKKSSLNPIEVKEKSVSLEVPSLKILLVDDDPVNLKVAKLMLMRQNHKVTTAIDGDKALKTYELDKFDLIFMDVNMNVMDGYEATQIIRQREKEIEEHIPIIALTALVFTEDKQKCLDSGMDAYVSKPFRSENLAEVIESFFGNKGGNNTLIPKEIESTILDKEAVFSRAGNDWEILELIVETYYEHSQILISKLENATKERDLEEIGSVAHTLKGTLGTLGSIDAYNNALTLEKVAKLGKVEDIGAIFKVLKDTVMIFDKALKQFMQERIM